MFDLMNGETKRAKTELDSLDKQVNQMFKSEREKSAKKSDDYHSGYQDAVLDCKNLITKAQKSL